MRIKINESIEQNIINDLLIESFNPSAEKVLLVKEYLDNNFTKDKIDDVSGGYPKKVGVVNMISDGQIVKQLQGDEMLCLLDDKFLEIITNDNDRKKFLKQILIDWYNNDISREGLLSVNTI